MIAILALNALLLTVSISLQDGSTSSDPRSATHGTGRFDQLAQAAKQARDENRDDSAIDFYQQALKLKPEWDEGLWYLGTLLYEKENYVGAGAALRRFLDQNPGNGKGWALLGLSEYETHEYAQTLDHLQRSKVLGFGDDKEMNSTVSYITAILLTRSGKFGESLTLLDARVASGEDSSQMIEPIGLAALHMPLLPAEISADRRDIVHMTGAGVLAVQTQRYADANKLFAGLESVYANQPEVHFLIGSYLLGAGARPEEGIKEMKREIEISPSHVPARIRLAEEYIERQELDKGISFAQEALKLAPNDAMAHMVLGEGLVAKGDSAGGIKELETARDSSPEEIRIRWDLARAYTSAGRTQDARREKSEIERLGRQDAVH
jgi:tetratricopeptide (TPR) repeat protein